MKKIDFYFKQKCLFEEYYQVANEKEVFLNSGPRFFSFKLLNFQFKIE